MTLENEKSVFGAAFLEPQAMDTALSLLRPNDFSIPEHRLLFSVMAEMADESIEPNMVTLTTELEKRKKLQSVGGTEYLCQLIDYVPSAAVINYACKQVKESAGKRRILDLAVMIDDNRDMPATELRAMVESVMFDFDDSATGPKHIKAVAGEALKMAEKAYNNRGEITGIPTGFEMFDFLMNGLNAPDLTIIAGRPGMGKSAFMGNVVEHVAIREEKPAVIFSLEMSNTQLFQRMLYGRARVDSARARVGNFQEQDWPRMTHRTGEISSSPIWLDDTPGLHISELRARARSLNRRENIALICVDYLQLVRGDGDNRVQEVGSISRGLKGMAKELDIPVIALCQLSRKVEERTNKRPMMSDLRDSGEIEQDADNIVFLYREHVYEKNADKRKAEAIIAKQRNGPTGIVELNWVGEFSRFENRREG